MNEIIEQYEKEGGSLRSEGDMHAFVTLWVIVILTIWGIEVLDLHGSAM